jgi:hypothetical protein
VVTAIDRSASPVSTNFVTTDRAAAAGRRSSSAAWHRILSDGSCGVLGRPRRRLERVA